MVTSPGIRALLAPGWVRDALWARAQRVPSLDLRFAANRSLRDAVTGQSLVTFTRASNATVVGTTGLIETVANDVPRFDHDPVTGACRGLLVEEQRTNLLLRSEEFDNASWTKSTATVTPNAVLAPDGQLTADSLIPANLAGFGDCQQVLAKAASPVQYTLSCFAKAKEHSAFRLILRDPANSANRADVVVSLVTGATSGSFVGGTYSGLTSSVVFLPNGWIRFSITATTGPETSVRAQVINNSTGDGTSGIYLWGAQLEAGAFPTSYIATSGTSATRSADAAVITGSNFSSWYNQSQGTAYTEMASIYNSGRYLMFDDGTTNNRWETRYSSFLATFASWTAGVQDGSANTSVAPSSPATNVKVAAAHTLNNAAITSNGAGATLGTDTSVLMPPSLTRLFIGSFQGTATYANGSISRLVYWGQRLPNSTLQALTQ